MSDKKSIFLTVGTQLPFERLVKALDHWAQENPDVAVFGQIGETEYTPTAMTYVERIDPNTYSEKFDEATIVVSHVGMGTIISGLEKAKPLVLMPRLAALGEHRNDHQLGTAKKFSDRALIDVVDDESALFTAISQRLAQADNCAAEELVTSQRLINEIKHFVHG